MAEYSIAPKPRGVLTAMCPHCGGKPVVKTTTDGDTFKVTTKIACMKCGAATETVDHENWLDAHDKWNDGAVNRPE